LRPYDVPPYVTTPNLILKTFLTFADSK